MMRPRNCKTCKGTFNLAQIRYWRQLRTVQELTRNSERSSKYRLRDREAGIILVNGTEAQENQRQMLIPVQTSESRA